MKCARPNCPNTAKKYHRGLCSKHHIQDSKDRTARGEPLRIPSSEVDAYVQRLRDAGLGYRRIADLANASVRTVQRLKVTSYVRWDTAQRLYAIPLPDDSTYLLRNAAPATLLPVVGTKRRLRALTALGYTNKHIAERLGMTKNFVEHLSSERRNYVAVATARRVDALYQELWRSTPEPFDIPNKRAVLRAQRRGWAPPMAWDDIDDPREVADEHLRTTKVSAISEYRELMALGVSKHEALDRAGLKSKSAARMNARAS